MMRVLSAAAAAALLLAGTAGAQAVRNMQPDAQQAMQAAAREVQTLLQTTQAQCQGGDQEACTANQRLESARQEMRRLFDACAGGDQTACRQHDEAVARIVAGMDGQGRAGQAQQPAEEPAVEEQPAEGGKPVEGGKAV